MPYVAALDAWSRQGIPRNPGAWLTTDGAAARAGRAAPGPHPAGQLPLLIEPGSGPDAAGAGDARRAGRRTRGRRDPRRPAPPGVHLLPSRRWPARPRWR